MHKTLRFVVWLALAALLVVAPVAIAAPTPAPSRPGPAPFDPYILEMIKQDGQADFFVVLKIQADLSATQNLPTKEAKGQYVFDALTEVAAKTQGPILAALKAEGATFKPMWIRNMIKVHGDKALLLEMAARPDVAEIIYEYPATPDVVGKGTVDRSANAPEAPEWGITRVGAPAVWALGITGAGAVVGDLDTGVQWNHPALINAYRGNLGGGSYDHNYNWYDGGMTTVPTDYAQHGTHTMGTIVGDDGAGNQIGMAPGAKWIACPGIGSPYVGPFECFQFFLAPTDLAGNNPNPALAPHVISNSWSSAGTNYHPAIQTLYAAGIFFSKSAGNTGSQCGTITNPGQWPEVTAAAAFANGDTIASFSSRGPVTIGYDKFVKPDIAAPGSGVRSSIPGSSYGSMSGTSMACPHVTGAVALLISANPALAGNIDVLQMLLKMNAEPKVSTQCPPFVDTPNDVWGWGILDVEAAVLAAQTVSLGGIEGTVTDSTTTAPIEGAALTFTHAGNGWPLTGASAADGSYSQTLPAATYDVTANHYGYLPEENLGVTVSAGATTTLNISMDPAPVWTVSGLVDEQGTGTPLEASILFANTPVTASTDPDTGLYSADVAQGTWWMDVRSPGHTKEVRQVAVDSDRTENFTLTPVQNYYMRTGSECGPAFEWIDATGGTPRPLGDDAYVSVALPTGRSFTFYGNTYTSLYVGSNGIVTFGSPNDKWSGPIPDPATPNNGIYAFSTDLDPASGAHGNIYTQYVDNRYFVIEWYQVQHYPSGNPETFEIVLDLDTGKVRIQYHTVSDVSDAVSGVENSTGTEATQYAYADPALIASGATVDFYPMFSTPPPTGGPGILHGTVTDLASGDPIEGATVTALSFTTGESAVWTTGADGVYSDTVCADWYDLTVKAACYYDGTADQVAVRDGAETVQDFDLQPLPCDPIGQLEFTWTPADPIIGQPVTFSATVSGTEPIELTWAFGDGGTGSGASVAHTYTLTGTYTVVLTAKNCCDEQSVQHDVWVDQEPELVRIYLPIVVKNYSP